MIIAWKKDEQSSWLYMYMYLYIHINIYIYIYIYIYTYHIYICPFVHLFMSARFKLGTWEDHNQLDGHLFADYPIDHATLRTTVMARNTSYKY